MPFQFTLSTVIIVLSSLTFQFALISVKKGNLSFAKISIATTILLGLFFIATQYSGWTTLHDNGYFAAGKDSTQESSFLYLLTGLHIVHLIGGLFSLFVVLVKTFKNKYSLENIIGMEVSLIYWHFLGALWIFLFLFLRFIIA